MNVELVFIHGWGFDARFWNDLAPLLPPASQQRVDLGFFGAPRSLEANGSPQILIGHSLGFMHGITIGKNWKGWIAINGFARFPNKAQLAPMKERLKKNPPATLREFYRHIGAPPVTGKADVKRLEAGLDELKEGDISAALDRLNIPALILASPNDPLVPVGTSNELKGHTRQGRLLWHEAGGHMVAQSDPTFCAKAIADFLTPFFG
jgi:pimeloyl-[acyl-carrier protein] methyl ester esterase